MLPGLHSWDRLGIFIPRLFAEGEVNQEGDCSRMTTLVIHGNEACTRGAIAAGCRFFAGYPITPASEIPELMSRLLPPVRGVFVQMEDEIASICSALGAAWGGVKACTATSGPGFTLMQEGIGWAAETDTPVVVIDVMRGGPATGQPTASSQQDVMQAKYGSHGDYEIIALTPSSVQEAFDLTVKAFYLAEVYRNPVIILTDEIVGHTREKVRIPERVEEVPRQRPPQSPATYVPFRPKDNGLLEGMPAFNQGYGVLVDGQLHDERGIRAGHKADRSAELVRRICRKITDHAEALTDVEEWEVEDAEVVVLTYGSPARPAMRAAKEARAQGIRAGVLKIRLLWPFPQNVVDRICRTAGAILVPEMNVGKIKGEVERIVRGRSRVISLPKLGGELHTPAEIFAGIQSSG
jgi:2-oxoglutarate ferredoxin oxidoreductase subunit alpha